MTNNNYSIKEGEIMAQEEKINDTVQTTESVISALQKVITLLDRIKNAIEESRIKSPEHQSN